MTATRPSGRLLASVSQELQQPQAVGQRVVRWLADPARGDAAAQARRRGEHEAVLAEPAEPGYPGDRLGLAVQMAGPPLVLVGEDRPAQHKEKGPVPGAECYRAGPDHRPFHLAECRHSRLGWHVEHVK